MDLQTAADYVPDLLKSLDYLTSEGCDKIGIITTVSEIVDRITEHKQETQPSLRESKASLESSKSLLSQAEIILLQHENEVALASEATTGPPDPEKSELTLSFEGGFVGHPLVIHASLCPKDSRGLPAKLNEEPHRELTAILTGPDGVALPLQRLGYRVSCLPRQPGRHTAVWAWRGCQSTMAVAVKETLHGPGCMGPRVVCPGDRKEKCEAVGSLLLRGQSVFTARVINCLGGVAIGVTSGSSRWLYSCTGHCTVDGRRKGRGGRYGSGCEVVVRVDPTKVCFQLTDDGAVKGSKEMKLDGSQLRPIVITSYGGEEVELMI